MKIIKTEYAGNPKGYMKSKTELETVYGNGVERRKRTHIVCIRCEPKCNLCFYSYMTSDFAFHGNLHGELKGMGNQ